MKNKYRILDGYEEPQREQILKDWDSLLRIYKPKYKEITNALHKCALEVRRVHPSLTNEDIKDLYHY